MTKASSQFFRKILDSIKRKGLRIIKAQCALPRLVATHGMKAAYSFFGALFFAGRVILHYEPFKQGLVHQIVLSAISLLVIYVLKFFYITGEELLTFSSGLRKNTDNEKDISMYDYIDMMGKCKNSVWCFILPLFPSARFIYKTIYLEYVPKTLTGYYAALMGAIAFYIALIAYSHLLISIVYFWKIAHNKGNCLFLQFPHDLFSPPKWLSLWTSYFRRAEKAFFVTGTLFTYEYIALMPKGIITINSKIVINSKDPVAFISSWLVIVVLIIVAFPIISLVIRRLFRMLLNNMRQLALNELSSIYSDSSITEIWAYGQLSTSSMKFGSYIYQKKTFIPFIATAISFILNLFKLYESILIPLLSRI